MSDTTIFALVSTVINLVSDKVYPIYDIDNSVNVYCPECPPGGTIGHPGGQQNKFLPFGHGRDLVAFNGTG